MEEKKRTSWSPFASAGVILIVIGILLLVLQHVHLTISWLPATWKDFPWQLRMIFGGLVVFVIGLVLPGDAGQGLAGFGFVVAAVGALLWYQETTNTWSSWAYAWALVFPAAGGLAGIIHGTLHANWRHVRDSAGSLFFGLIAFVILGFVFERWLGFTGFGFGQLAPWIPGIVLLGAGVLVLLFGTPRDWDRRRLQEHERRTEHREPPAGDERRPAGPSDHGA